MSLIVDASMTVAWLFNDEGTARTREILRRVIHDGAVVPSLWRLEVANVLRTAVRKNRCTPAYADRSIARLTRLPIAVDPETDGRAWSDTRALSTASGLTTYDAAYLELAIRLNHPLATADRDLVAVAPLYNIQVLVP